MSNGILSTPTVCVIVTVILCQRQNRAGDDVGAKYFSCVVGRSRETNACSRHLVWAYTGEQFPFTPTGKIHGQEKVIFLQ